MAMNKCSSVQMFPRNLFDSLFTNCPVPLLLILLLLYHIIFRFAFYNSTSNPNKERQTDRETNTQNHTWWWSSWGPYGVQHVGHDATTREHIKTFHMLLSFFRRRFKGDCFFFFQGRREGDYRSYMGRVIKHSASHISFHKTFSQMFYDQCSSLTFPLHHEP